MRWNFWWCGRFFLSFVTFNKCIGFYANSYWQVFDQLKQEKPKFRHKIVGVSGDCVLPGLGIDPNQRQILRENVNIVFHVAATVRFDEKLKLALGINVNGTREMMLLSQEIRDLQVRIVLWTREQRNNFSKISTLGFRSRLYCVLQLQSNNNRGKDLQTIVDWWKCNQINGLYGWENIRVNYTTVCVHCT